jgi:hypothetical protein
MAAAVLAAARLARPPNPSSQNEQRSSISAAMWSNKRKAAIARAHQPGKPKESFFFSISLHAVPSSLLFLPHAVSCAG